MLFDVRLLAFDDAAVADPADALVRVFGLDRNAASELLRRLPHVVKRGVSEEGARKLVAALERIGAHTEIVLSAKKPPGAHGTQATQPAARAGALPAPAAAARAMIDARAAREAAAERASLGRTPVGQAGRASAYGAAAAALSESDHVYDPDDDSLEADIDMQPRITPMMERATIAVERPGPVAKPTDRAPVAVRPGATSRSLAAAMQQAPAAAPRLSSPQGGIAVAMAASQAATSPVSQTFRTSLPQPSLPQPSLPHTVPAAQQVAPFVVSLPQVTPANLQRPLQASVGAVSATNVPTAKQRPSLPTLSIHGPPVEASVCIVPGTKTALVVAWLIALLLATTLTVFSLGILTVVSAVALSVAWLSRRRMLASVRASALPVGQSQLPELYACLKQFALRLGLASVPRFYVVRHNQEGLRTTTDGRELVFMIDEFTLLRFIESPRPQALSFLIAQELCRHALGHTKWTRRMLARVSPRLACLDLVSADSAATALVSDHTLVKAALLTLLGASRLHAYVDIDELDRVATSTTREPAFWPTRFGADDGFVLARLYHLQRGYV